MTSIKRVLCVAGGVLATVALSSTYFFAKGGSTVDLPFYSDRTFAPSWTAVDHSVTAGTAADEVFVDQTGESFTLASLRGRVHVASFIFTRCSVICPPLVSSMAKIQESTAGTDLALLSYSVTPDLDTVDVLREFGDDRDVDPARWKLLTGNPTGLLRIAHDVYFADDDGVREALEQPDAFLHTEKLLLIDQNGHIRGVYSGTHPFDVQKLIEDARTLLS